ncbi:hypothetical protein BLL42_01670 [Pseudomonas frederiksbergensis]|uniref:Uncharacterized protein n=1 Tax=Pseudomonas frederiksbergensis TaxID=104087 RepID=A0A1J0EEM8_9PSED|nr:hypothetical protein [Pseudomonas frederiksbergensis]APC14505.1 hypothetical protein BLL42_01670 [Pseudomonas frederiksbergensis]
MNNACRQITHQSPACSGEESTHGVTLTGCAPNRCMKADLMAQLPGLLLAKLNLAEARNTRNRRPST